MLRRGLILLTAVATMGVVAPAVADGVASAATVHAVGNLSASQNTFTHRVRVHGWAFDPDHRSSPVGVRVYVDGKYRGHTMTDRFSRYVNHRHHLQGRHAYTLWVTVPGRAHRVSAHSYGAHKHKQRTVLSKRTVSHHYPSRSSRLMTVARKLVGERYTYGGDNPRSGFDCSGLTKYVYDKANVAHLPHRTDDQLRVKRIHLVSFHRARPGDIVFYMDGGRPFHVAVYAGHHNQISAATTRDGVRFQNVWSGNVRYGHYS